MTLARGRQTYLFISRARQLGQAILGKSSKVGGDGKSCYTYTGYWQYG